MTTLKTLSLSGLALAAIGTTACAEGALNIYNFGLYTPPDLIEKFEKEYDVDVTVTEFDANEQAMAKIEAGGHGFDVIVSSGYFVPVYLEKGLLLESRPDQMENFGNIAADWATPSFDPDRHYTAPWVWGTTGVMVNTKLYDGDINTAAMFLDPPDALKGSINVVPTMNDTIDMTLTYLGGTPCTDDKAMLKAARDKLLEAKANWASIDYASFEKFVNEDLNASLFWSGASMRIRESNPGFAYGYPKEGFPVWQDNVAVLADAQNVDNAKLFLNFIMAPENAALLSNYLGYGNGITGSEDFMTPGLTDQPEMNIPEDLAGAGFPQQLCSPDVQKLYTQIWTELTK